MHMCIGSQCASVCSPYVVLQYPAPSIGFLLLVFSVWEYMLECMLCTLGLLNDHCLQLFSVGNL